MDAEEKEKQQILEESTKKMESEFEEKKRKEKDKHEENKRKLEIDYKKKSLQNNFVTRIQQWTKRNNQRNLIKSQSN